MVAIKCLTGVSQRNKNGEYSVRFTFFAFCVPCA